MDFDLHGHITHPAALVLATMIERMESIVPFLENVEGIETLDRRELPGGRIHIVRRWQGASTAVPLPLRPFLSRELFAWIDTAIWTPTAHKVEWTHSMAVSHVAKLYDCTGVNYFEPAPSAPDVATRVRLTGSLRVHGDAVPGVPAFVARRLVPEVERFVIGMIKPNLGSLTKGLQRYLDEVGR
jgi:hypothetical protein